VGKKKNNMLVVDDDPSFQDLLRQFFTLRGWNVLVAGDAEDAIHLYRRHHPSAVISDVNLGSGRDGVSLCHQIREDLSSRHTAILLVSAERRTARDQVQGGEAGADDYLLKPVSLVDLDERLNAAVETKRGELKKA
jgi:DNA-binding response OmpR family regulator